MTWDPTKATEMANGSPIRDLQRLSEPLATGEIWVGVDVSNRRKCWFEGGIYSSNPDSGFDLVNVESERIKRTMFTNLYQGSDEAMVTLFPTVEKAIAAAAGDCIARAIPIEIDCAVGEGLEEEVHYERWVAISYHGRTSSWGTQAKAEEIAEGWMECGHKVGIFHICEDVPVK